MPGSLYNLGKAVVTINGKDTDIKLDATKVEMEVVDDVFNHHSGFSSVPDHEVRLTREVILRCEFTEEMVVSAGVSADPAKGKKVADLIRVIRLKK